MPKMWIHLVQPNHQTPTMPTLPLYQMERTTQKGNESMTTQTEETQTQKTQNQKNRKPNEVQPINKPLLWLKTSTRLWDYGIGMPMFI